MKIFALIIFFVPWLATAQTTVTNLTKNSQVTTGTPLSATVTGGGGGGGGSAFPSDSIVLNWKFNRDTTDSSGNGNNGTAHGTTSFVADETGAASKAISLDGSTAYVDTGSPTIANFTSGNFSVVLYCTNTESGFDTSPVLWGNAIFGGNGYYFQRHTAFAGGDDAATLEFQFHDGGGDHTILATDRSMTPITQNYCLVFVRSGTSGKIYVNGTEVTDVSQPNIGTISSNTSNNFTVGKYLGNSNFFTGKVQQLIVYSRALTSIEVATGSAGTSQ